MVLASSLSLSLHSSPNELLRVFRPLVPLDTGTLCTMSSTAHTALARYRVLAPSASVRVSPLCLGAMAFSEANQERYGKITKQDAFHIMDWFFESGGNFIDTANAYQAGQYEEWVGEWMKAKGNRDEIVLATNYTSPHMSHDKGRIQANFGGNGTKNMRQSIEGSLKRLQTSHIDLYYVHW